MLALHAPHGARLTITADFSQGPVLNLDFLDAEGQTIPFHVSLRRDEGLVVINRRDTAGWRREIRFALTLPPARVTLVIDLTPRRVQVWLDGWPLGRFDAWPRPSREGRFFLRRGFPDLGRITALSSAGVPAQIDIARPGPVPQGLHLTDDLRAALVTDAPEAGVVLELGPSGEVLPAIATALPVLGRDGRPLRALVAEVPGRLWLGQGEAVTLTLRSGAGVLGQMHLTRADVARRLPDALARGGAAALLALEHARHGALAPLLPAAAKRQLARQARHFGLTGWLGDLGLPRPEVPAPAPAQGVAGDLLARLRTDPAGAEGHIRRALTQLPDRPAQLALLDQTVEWACLTGQVPLVESLRQAVLAGQPTGPVAPGGWAQSVALPRLWHEGAWAEVAATLHRLRAPGVGWIVTPAVGWVASAAARWQSDAAGHPPPDWQLADIVSAWADLIDAQSHGYWSRLPCRCLRAGMAALLQAADRLPRTLRERLVWLAIRAYALDPAFWADLPESAVAHPALTAARQDFALLHRLIQTAAPGEALRPVIQRLRALGAAGIDRFARDLLGPGADGLGADSLLRAALAPGAPADTAPADPRALRQALAEATPHIPAAPLREAALSAVARARGVLAGAPVADLVPALAAVGGATSRFLGLALALDTTRGLIAAGRGDEAGPLLSLATSLAEALPDTGLPPAVAGALAALRADHPALGRGLTGALAQRELAELPPVPAHTADLHRQSGPLTDTLVCLYSCRAHLPTRVAAIRQGWGARLAALGVPMLVFVGGGDGTRQGDTVALDCPDDYEGLPQKTLAMVRWVQDNTRFAHLVKVDDDCALDPAGWFGDLAHRLADYYGRPLFRVPGQMDRTWHMAKSTSARGRLGLDRSPEPSSYADGGSGYALSRRAMAALLQEAATPEGRALVAQSFMEDKLTGDLLARRGITVDGTDYRVSVLRRSSPQGPRVPAWENGIAPFAGSGLRLVHLDGIEDMPATVAGFDRPRPAPGKIWPSFQNARLGPGSNTLDLLTPPDRLAAARSAPVALVACLRNEAPLLPQFLAHYRALGVGAFLIADNGSDDGGLEWLCAQPDVSVFAVDTEYRLSQYGVAWQQALMAQYRCGRWSLVADADEFLMPGTAASLPDLAATLETEGADAARVLMLDMYPEGPLSAVDPARGSLFDLAPCVESQPFLARSAACGPFSEAPVLTSALRHRLIPGARPELFVAHKVALLRYRPWMRLTAGLHFVAGTRLARRDLVFAHFKYTAAFRARVQAEVTRRQHFNDAEEYRQYQALLAEGREVLFDPAVSMPWRDNALVQALLAGGRLDARGQPE